MHHWFALISYAKAGLEVQVFGFLLRSVDSGAGMAAVIQRAFAFQARAYFSPLIEVGVCGLYAMAWELTPGGGGIAAPVFGFHWEWGVALNRPTYARLE